MKVLRSVKLCPMRAAHFAGQRMLEKSPSALIRPLDVKSTPSCMKGAMYL